MMRIAHRGLAGLYPENTRLSFEKALDFTPDAMEIDVQMTKDGKLVVFHDEELGRMTKGVKGWLKDYTYEELCQLEIGGDFDVPPQRILTLDEYFDLVDSSDIKTFVELKNSFIVYSGLEEKTLEVITNHHQREKCIVYSANHFSVMDFKAMAPDIEVCFPFDNWIFDRGHYCEKYGVTMTIPYYLSLTKQDIDDFHEHGVSVYPWTIDDPVKMKAMLKMGADGMLTNRIDLLNEI